MDWNTFLIVVGVSVFAVYPGFEFFQYLAIRRGQIPRRGEVEWKGRSFFHWDRYKTLLFGDLLFASLFNGFAICLFSLERNHLGTLYFVAAALIALVITGAWFAQAKRRFETGDMRTLRWDWAFTASNGRPPISGLYHLVYFAFEAFLVSFTLLMLISVPIERFILLGLICSSAGYIATLLYDMYDIGMFLGPRTG
ncbi:MAG: hypothetical protein G01um10148_259 [Parcubacteria group bacterium Gr01-1014_8]|nr:MAG: hypothetical protein G01um10148_259 [Parcubacteria group bacterium Gr01-1014_8]